MATLTYEEAAQALDITYESLRNLVATGKLHPVKVPGRRYKLLEAAEVARYRQKGHTVLLDEDHWQLLQELLAALQAQINPSLTPQQVLQRLIRERHAALDAWLRQLQGEQLEALLAFEHANPPR